jgi:type 1 glutamine amidotransferase
MYMPPVTKRRGNGWELIAGVALTLLLAMASSRGARAREPECPAAWQPYSSNTLLIDLLLDPRTKAALHDHKVVPETPFLSNPTPPTFAALITPRWLLNSDILSLIPGAAQTDPEPKLEALDRALADIPVTEEAAERRCARYDHVAPDLPKPTRRPAILVFEKVTGFLDKASFNAAHQALAEMAARRGWSITFTANGAVFNATQLQTYDAVIWNNVSGDALTLPQRKAFQDYLAAGGGFAGMHGSGGDFVYLWPWYRDVLIGAQFIGHTRSPQFQAAKVVIEGPKTGIVAKLPDSWTMTEEWYSFADSPRARGAHVLARLDETTYAPAKLAMGDHPIAWTQCLGSGRSFYTAIGHRPESYRDPNARALLEEGVAWAAGVGDTRCDAGREVAATPHQKAR